MQVTKIDIIQTPMEIENRRYVDFFKLGETSPWFNELEHSDLMKYPVIQKERYEVQELKENLQDSKYFLVKIDDRGVFDKLKIIQDNTFWRAIDERTKYNKSQYENNLFYHKTQYQKETERLKNLSWWRRLFKRWQ